MLSWLDKSFPLWSATQKWCFGRMCIVSDEFSVQYLIRCVCLSLQTCLRESDGSDEEDSLSSHSEDRFSEGSWDRVERKDTEVSLSLSDAVQYSWWWFESLTSLFLDAQVTRWVPDHMASHCFNCDCEFWIAKRRHHCRCGPVWFLRHTSRSVKDHHIFRLFPALFPSEILINVKCFVNIRNSHQLVYYRSLKYLIVISVLTVVYWILLYYIVLVAIQTWFQQTTEICDWFLNCIDQIFDWVRSVCFVCILYF